MVKGGVWWMAIEGDEELKQLEVFCSIVVEREPSVVLYIYT